MTKTKTRTPSRRDLVASALASAGVLALSSRGQAATPIEGGAPDTCTEGWTEWIDVAVKATHEAWDTSLAEADLVDGVIDGPVLTNLHVELPKGVVAEKVLSALVSVGMPKALAKPWAKTADRAWVRQWRRWELPPSKAFPSFAAVASPEVPPTEGVPVVLQPSASKGWSGLTAEALYVDLTDRVGDLQNIPGVPEALKAWAFRVSAPFAEYDRSATLSGLWGQGKVPSFAPPYVPVGPVVAGDNIAAPGHTAARGVIKPTLTALASVNTKE